MRLITKNFFLSVLLLVAGIVQAQSGGKLPLRVIVNEVEQTNSESASIPAFRRQVGQPERLQDAIDAQERHTNALLQEPGVLGTAAGWNAAGEPVIKVYMSTSASSSGLPQSLDGIPLVVENIGQVFALNLDCASRGDCDTAQASSDPEPGPREYQPRPVPIGVSSGHYNVTAGTLACRVSNGCHSYALSNAHVFADENNGMVGDNILQPGDFDGGINPDDSIGTLYDSVPLDFSETGTNVVDAAIAAVSPADVGSATPSDGYGMPKASILAASVDLNVMKYGRTSRLTYGYVDAVNATVLVTYDSGDALFVGQIIVKRTGGGDFSRPGDSGALLVASGGADERRPVGLIFASGSEISVANPIADVLTLLDVDIDGE